MSQDHKIWVENWLETKAANTVSLRILWATILEPLKAIPHAHLNPILRVLNHPSSARTIFNSIMRCENPEFTVEKFYEMVDQYSISTEDWLEAIEYFITWNETHRKSPTFSAAIDYISCCADWQDSKPESGSLKQITADMLEKFGWDGQDSGCIQAR